MKITQRSGVSMVSVSKARKSVEKNQIRAQMEQLQEAAMLESQKPPRVAPGQAVSKRSQMRGGPPAQTSDSQHSSQTNSSKQPPQESKNKSEENTSSNVSSWA